MTKARAEIQRAAGVIDAIKSEIVDEIRYDARELSQRQLVARTGLPQSDISYILAGKTGRFTIDRLLMVLIALGHRPRISVC